MENTLQNICCEKVRASRQAYLTPEGENCKNVCNGFNYECEFYIPVKVTELNIRQGQFAFELMRAG